MHMFAKALDKASGFLRPVHSVYRYYNEAVVNKTAFNIVFVNESGVAITARHVAERMEKLTGAHDHYRSFLREKEKLRGTNKSSGLRRLETEYGYRGKDTFPAVQAKLRFFDCFTEPCPRFRILHHPIHDLSVLVFENFGKRLYKSWARIAKDPSCFRPGTSVCKIGYINPQFTNYVFDAEKNELAFTNYADRDPVFYPVEGIITRPLILGYYTYALETSTPGLKGQSGGPLINSKGDVCGLNINVASLEFQYNFKIPASETLKEPVTINYQPKLLVGNCLHADIIVSFLKYYKLKYYTA